MRRAILLTVLLAVLAAPACASAAGGSSKGLFSITPARREITGRPPKVLVPTDVFNGTQETFDVKVFPVLLIQHLDGGFDFNPDAADLRKAQLTVAASPDHFVMGPGTQKRVTVRWENIERGTYESYIGLVFQGTPRTKSGGVGNILRLLSLNFLGLPHRPAPRGKFAALAVDSIQHKLHFLVDVKNTGRVLGRPQDTSLLVRDSSGKLVLRKSWNGDIILPGVTRRFDVMALKVLQKGRYVATAKMRFGASARQSISKAFTLVGPNELPTAVLSIHDPVGSGEVHKQAHVHAVISNTGTGPAGTRASVTLSVLAPAPRPIAVKRLTVAPLAPRSSRPLDVDLGPALHKGSYRVLIRYRDATGALQEVSADFSPTVPRPSKSNFWGAFKFVLIGLGALLVLLLILWLLRRQRRLRERLAALEAEKTRPAVAPPPPAPAATAPPAEPAAAGTVNVNTASLAELQTLPGVGPKAAERIVAHREEYGAFSSLDDLAQVEGFGPARIEQLRDRASV